MFGAADPDLGVQVFEQGVQKRFFIFFFWQGGIMTYDDADIFEIIEFTLVPHALDGCTHLGQAKATGSAGKYSDPFMSANGIPDTCPLEILHDIFNGFTQHIDLFHVSHTYALCMTQPGDRYFPWIDTHDL